MAARCVVIGSIPKQRKPQEKWTCCPHANHQSSGEQRREEQRNKNRKKSGVGNITDLAWNPAPTPSPGPEFSASGIDKTTKSGFRRQTKGKAPPPGSDGGRKLRQKKKKSFDKRTTENPMATVAQRLPQGFGRGILPGISRNGMCATPEASAGRKGRRSALHTARIKTRMAAFFRAAPPQRARPALLPGLTTSAILTAHSRTRDNAEITGSGVQITLSGVK